jgi:hypothetical protein
VPEYDGHFSCDIFWIVVGDLSLFEFLNHQNMCDMRVEAMVSSIAAQIHPPTMLVAECTQVIPLSVCCDSGLSCTLSIWVHCEDGVKYHKEISSFAAVINEQEMKKRGT